MSEARGIDAIVVNWNGRPFLPRCLESLGASSVPLRVIVVDNASRDGSVEYVREAHPHVDLLALEANLGYAGGANAGLAASSAPFAMILNPDVILAPDHLEVLAARMERDPAIGAAQGKLYRVSPGDFAAGHLPTDTLDSTGHVIARTRMVYDRGQDRPDRGEWDAEAPVFSASGAALMLRRAMLDDVAPGGDPFDPAFFAFKEDIDLCWRARILGWDIRYVPAAVGWHVRAVPGPGRKGRGTPAAARRHSWMNHWLMILKNDRASDLLRHLPWVLGWEVARAGHALLRDPRLLPAYARVWTRVPAAWRARRDIQERRRAAPADLSAWFGKDTPTAPPVAAYHKGAS